MKHQKSRFAGLCGLLIGGFFFLGSTLPLSAQEFRKDLELKGVITGSVETGKLMLSSGDKIYIGLEKELSLKHGDSIEIFQAALMPEKEGDPALFRRVGRGTLLEIIGSKLLLCIIDQSTQEIAVGDRVWVGLAK
jgi:hypothetical protein